MRKKWIAFLSAVMLMTSAVAVSSLDKSATQTVSATETPKTYGLYTSQTLADATGGKVFASTTTSDALIYCMDGDGDGLNQTGRKVACVDHYYAKSTDTAYAYNAANIGETPSGTSVYQTYGYSEVFYQGHSGGNQRGGEWVLADTVDTESYGAISVDIGYKSTNPLNGDVEGETVVYVYGLDKDGEKVVASKKVPFGVNYWTTGIVEFSEEMVSVSRIAVSMLWNTVTNQNVSGSNTYAYLRGFTVHARAEVTDEVLLSANDMDVTFYNGNNMASALTSGKTTRVFHNNTGYSAMGGFTDGINDGAKEYIHGTQRISVGSYMTLQLRDPINVLDYKYLDVELFAYPQGAEGAYLKEEATEFTYTVLKATATDISQGTQYTLTAKEWKVCRINLSDFADADGYVKKIIFYYSGNNSGRADSEESSYTIQFAAHDMLLTNKEIDYSNVKLIRHQKGIDNTESKLSITLNSDIVLKYKLVLDTSVYGSPIATFSFDNEETVIDTFVKESENVYLFTFDKITAQYMGASFDMKITANCKSLNNTRVTVAEKTDYSVKTYLETLLASDAETLGIGEAKFAKMQTLVVDLLNYGAAAQVYTDTDVENLVNEDIETYQNKASAFDDTIESQLYRVSSTDGKISFTAARLWIDSEVNVGFKLQVAADVDIATLSAKVKVGGGEWVDAEITPTLEIKATNISASQFDETIAVEIFVNGESTGAICKYSVNSYIARNKDSADMLAFVKALYCYGKGALAYNND